MKYKVGDKVRIVDHRTVDMNDEGKMDKWLGKVMTVKGIIGANYKMKEDYGEHCGSGWFWRDEMIQGLAYQNKIVITTKGNEVTARLYDGKKIVKSATAKCSPKDEFDFLTGAKIAFERLTKPEEKPKYYNGKAVCVKTCCPEWFTVGKVYEFIDGKCIDDDGDKRLTHKGVETLEEFNEIMNVEFIELVED